MLIDLYICIICSTRYFYTPITGIGDLGCRICGNKDCFDISALDIDKEVLEAEKNLKKLIKNVEILEKRYEYLLEVQKANP